VLATHTWTGLGADSNWKTAANWQGNLAPAFDDDLVFPAGALRLSNTNNFAANTQFNTIRFTGTHYTLAGNAITLIGGITSTARSSNAVEFGIKLEGVARTVNTAADATLDLRGVISGPAYLVKEGPGTVLFSGASSNTYGNATYVDAGTLLLNKSAGAQAVRLGGAGHRQARRDGRGAPAGRQPDR
jgi:autotransporter-associated beta strand protein